MLYRPRVTLSRVKSRDLESEIRQSRRGAVADGIITIFTPPCRIGHWASQIVVFANRQSIALVDYTGSSPNE